MANRQISPERQQMYYVGMGMQGVGILLIVVGFVTFAALGEQSVKSFGEGPSPLIGFFMCFGGMVLTAVGRGIQSAAARGLAGSGLVLDPERARKDVEPWSRMAGGVVKDGLDETGLLQNETEDFDTRLRKLHQLFQDGILTQEEYQKAKDQILASRL